MKPLPYPIRIAAGLVATVVEQARDLPRLVVEFPVTAVSQALQASMRVQQRITELAIKGDRALGSLRPVEEKPSWATFDDDEEEPRNGSAPVTELRRPGAERIPVAQPPTADRPTARPGTDRAPAARPSATESSAAEPAAARPAAERIPVARPSAPEPEPAAVPPDGAGPDVLPNYPEISIPQLRARLRNLSIDDLKALLDWENDHGSRTTYVTMLTNRIITVTEG